MDSDESGCEVIFLNRVLRIVHPENRPSFEIEGDCRNAEIIVSELGLRSEKTKTVDTPENRDGMESCAGSRLLISPLLSGDDTKKYRSMTMRAAFLATHRADLGNCVKNLARRMQQPPREFEMQRWSDI